MDQSSTTALVAFGANQGDTAATFDAVVEALRTADGIRVTAVSRLHRTTPVGGPAGQADYANAVLRIETTLEPQALLHLLQQWEDRLGRIRQQRWGPRQVDLDLLLYGNHVQATRSLIVPHPRMAFRQFVLIPACEVGSELIDPQTGWTLDRLRDHMLRAANYVAIVGVDWQVKQTLIAELAKRFPMRRLECPVSDWRQWTAEWEQTLLPLIAPLESSSPVFQHLAACEWVASDYSIRELISWAKVFVDQPRQSQWIAQLRQAIEGRASEKFTIFLDHSVPRAADSAADRFAAVLRAEMAQPNHGPVLHLGGECSQEDWQVDWQVDWQRVVEEASSALQAIVGL